VAETRDPKWEDGQCARNRLTLPNLVVLLPPVIKQAGLTKFKVIADVLEKKKKARQNVDEKEIRPGQAGGGGRMKNAVRSTLIWPKETCSNHVLHSMYISARTDQCGFWLIRWLSDDVCVHINASTVANKSDRRPRQEDARLKTHRGWHVAVAFSNFSVRIKKEISTNKKRRHSETQFLTIQLLKSKR
jgi:hypothetical protein